MFIFTKKKKKKKEKLYLNIFLSKQTVNEKNNY